MLLPLEMARLVGRLSNFITNIRYDREVKVFVVSENGASVYSASKYREEFPEYDVTVRGLYRLAGD